jgi:ADP-heptose:LPS heptosyltransferase
MKLLIIRTSAMGDVALLAPVLKSMEVQYPDNEIVLITRPAFAPFFYSFSETKLFLVDFKRRHKGFSGIFRLWSDLKKEHKFNYVIDLHDVLRSKILRWLFELSGVPVRSVNKARIEKRDVLSGRKKIQLMHSADRYYEVFTNAGFPLKHAGGPWIKPSPEGIKRAAKLVTETELLHIGIAPYAKHDLKMWPENNMIRLMEMIAEKRKVRFWLFGGKEETPQLITMQNRIPESVLVAGTLSLDEELALISRLDFMISMDSSNMHMAALTGTKVISIWGGTDPLTGFGAWQQPDEFTIRIPVAELTCRPCTVYGKGKCRRGDFACMNWLTPEIVFEKLYNSGLLNNSPFEGG